MRTEATSQLEHERSDASSIIGSPLWGISPLDCLGAAVRARCGSRRTEKCVPTSSRLPGTIPIAKQPPKFPPYLGRLAPLRCGFNGAQPMAIVAVPLARRCPRALPTMEPAPAVLHSRLPAYRARPSLCPASRSARGIASRIAVLQPAKRREVVAHFRLPPRRREPPSDTSPRVPRTPRVNSPARVTPTTPSGPRIDEIPRASPLCLGPRGSSSNELE
jgi:hypothetical protein